MLTCIIPALLELNPDWPLGYYENAAIDPNTGNVIGI